MIAGGILSAGVDRRHQLLHERPGSLAMRLEDVVEILGDDETELLVMELVAGEERTIDGFARDGELVVAHPKTREGMRAGLAMFFETLDDAFLMDVAALLGFGGLWLAFFAWQLGKRPLIPINDPQFESTLEQMHAGGH